MPTTPLGKMWYRCTSASTCVSWFTFAYERVSVCVTVQYVLDYMCYMHPHMFVSQVVSLMMTSSDSMSNINEVTVLRILQHVSSKAILLPLLYVSVCFMEDLMQNYNLRCRVLVQ